ncbi:MAG: glycogen/starch synthase [Dysgonamonadaceae bacterium]|jgi:glycosyltransferase involved in cell wall biosynthesis|nr:glycogen/starch synthase [Dysgonamonadaceae bacterium]
MVDIPEEKTDFIFESSWEICNKVGGIYTVLSTRANTLQTLFPDKIIFIGPDVWQGKNNPDFIENKTIWRTWKKQVAATLHLPVRVGRWNVPGQPLAILVDFYPNYKLKNAIYYEMWERYGIDSTAGYGDYDESCMFAYAAAQVIESLYHHLKLENKKVIAHLNEWMLSMAALYLHAHVPAIATVFTTHATSIGRSICSNNKPLYEQFTHYDGDQMAQELNMVGKHRLEKQAAHHVDCFTTVSEITAKECAQLLDKQPDIVTPNGFEAGFVPEGKAFTEKQKMARKVLLQVASQLTGSDISDEALLIATAGRYEYRNKGLDVFIESMHRVKQSNPNREIVAFILVPAWIKGAGSSSTFVTHQLVEPEHDKICEYLHYLRFTNEDKSPVKIIFVPSYLTGNDGVFNLPYYDLLTGFDLTVYPSYYEPWGYTPLESIAFHIPTITTDLAGFGAWAQSMLSTLPSVLSDGVQVIHRTDNNYFEIAEEIKNAILKYASLDEKQVTKARKSAHKLSEKAAWSHFIQYYKEAYSIALKNKFK